MPPMRRVAAEIEAYLAQYGVSGAGVTLFFAGTTYGVVKTSVVESWPRVTSKRISADVRAVAQGTFDFSQLEHLVAVSGQEGEEDKEKE